MYQGSDRDLKHQLTVHVLYVSLCTSECEHGPVQVGYVVCAVPSYRRKDSKCCNHAFVTASVAGSAADSVAVSTNDFGNLLL